VPVEGKEPGRGFDTHDNKSPQYNISYGKIQIQLAFQKSK